MRWWPRCLLAMVTSQVAAQRPADGQLVADRSYRFPAYRELTAVQQREVGRSMLTGAAYELRILSGGSHTMSERGVPRDGAVMQWFGGFPHARPRL